ncbi:MAG: pirin family protein [Rhodoluna sp.]|nr:pirin family protein [Rhodoluna sp.]
MSQILEPRIVKLTTRTEVDIKRNLPHAHLRRIGAWVFLDHFGPTAQVDGMVVAAHPHTGLQTVTWPFAGRVDHRDSIGSQQIIEPGQLNLMTAGRGIAHSEQSLVGPSELHSVQLWVALPDAVREMAPTFEHLGNPPTFTLSCLEAIVFIGSLGGVESPASVYSPLVGAELKVSGNATFPINQDWEHGVLVVEGDAEVNGEMVLKDSLIFLPAGANAINLQGNCKLLLIGGEPFAEPIVMWWNFIARTSEEIVEMRETWNARDPQFGEVADEVGGWIPAPELPNVTLRARV